MDEIAASLCKYLNRKEFMEYVRSTRLPRIYFDSETGPLDKHHLMEMFDESKIKYPDPPEPFDPSKVKYGNRKTEKARNDKLRDDEHRHFQKVVEYQEDCVKAKRKAWDDFVEGAALHPETAKVLGIGYGMWSPTGEILCLDIATDSEAQILEYFWSVVDAIRIRGGKLIGFNSNKFDIPMLTLRSYVNEVDPFYLLTKYGKMEIFCVDGLERWRMGRYGKGSSISLDNLAKLLGTRRKLEGMKGGDFHEVVKKDPGKAREYLELDVLSTIDVCRRLGA